MCYKVALHAMFNLLAITEFTAIYARSYVVNSQVVCIYGDAYANIRTYHSYICIVNERSRRMIYGFTNKNVIRVSEVDVWSARSVHRADVYDYNSGIVVKIVTFYALDTRPRTDLWHDNRGMEDRKELHIGRFDKRTYPQSANTSKRATVTISIYSLYIESQISHFKERHL